MAVQSGRLILDENHNVHINGKVNAMNSQRKSGLSGRKPLGDVSNSRKTVLNQSSKWQTTKNLTFIDEESGPKKKDILKGSERVPQGTRKVLSDISNSGKPGQNEALKKKLNLKLSTVREGSLHHVKICEERFLHNHQECIKAQNCSMDMNQFLRTVGLDAPKETAFKKKPDSPLKHLELNEMVEWPVLDQSPKKFCQFGRLDSSPLCKSPKSPSLDSFHLWKDSDSINFMLMKTP